MVFAALGHHLFDISIAQRKSKIEPSAMADNDGWQAISAVRWRIDDRHVHAAIATRQPAS
jgi:hypothetical protein